MMKKNKLLKTLLLLTVMLVGSAANVWAQNSETQTYSFDDGVALATDWDVTTTVPTGGSADYKITNNNEGGQFSDKGGNYLQFSYLDKGNVGITITSTASYDDITEISIDGIANDNNKPTFAVYVVTDDGDEEVLAAVGSKDGFNTGGTNKWGNKTITLETPLTGKLKIVTVASSAAKYAALDNIKITYSEEAIGTKYAVTYAPGEGTGSMEGAEYAEGRSFNLPTCTFTYPEGKSFIGWLCNIDNKVYEAGASYTMTAAATTFTAQYAKVIETVVYSLTDGIGSAEVAAEEATVNAGVSLVLTNTAGRIKLTPATGEQFKDGDAIKFSGTIGNTSKNYGVKYGNTTSINSGAIYVAGITSPLAASGTLVLSDASNELYIGRYDGTTTTLTSLVISRQLQVTSEAFGGVNVNGENVVENTDYTIDGTTITLNKSYVSAPSVSLINNVTLVDNTTTTVLVNVEFTTNGDYFTGTATIADQTFTVNVPVDASVIAPTITITASAVEVAKEGTITLTAEVTGNPAPTIQWYSNTSASNEGGTAIEGATSETYSPATTTSGTFYYYAVATNSQGNATSDVLTITVTASNKCDLYQVVYSNSFDAFIMAPSGAHGTCKAYYMEGTGVPSITSVEVSDGASYTVDGDVLTVTAEDGTTTAIYDITVEAVAPYEGGSRTFDGSETWVKTGNAFSTSSGKEGWLFSKNDTDWTRETPGKNRIYFFLAPSKSIKFENGGTARNINVYRNGELLSAPTSTSDCSIEGDESAPYMIAIVSNQTSGDGALKSITVTLSNVTIKPAHAASTYVTTQALDFSSVEGLKAYVVTGAANNTVTLEAVKAVPANTPLLLKGTANTEYTIPMAETATAPETNMLVAGDGKTKIGGNSRFDFILWSDGKFYRSQEGTVAVGKAYLHCESDPTVASEEAPALSIDWGEGTTGINSVERGALSVEGCYTLDGRRVAQPTKGLYIVNGRKVIIK